MLGAMTERLVIVGGGPAGLSAASSYRTHGGTGEVIICSADTAPPYERPPLSKDYLRGELDEAELAMEPETFYAEQSIDVRLNAEVTALDAHARQVRVGGDTLDFTTCVLATGSEPLRPPVEGAEHPKILTLRSLADARRLVAAASPAHHAVVVGSGFIGCEAAASLALRGLDVTLVSAETLPQRERLGADAGQIIAGWLRDLGVHTVLGRQLGAFAPDATGVRLDDGREIGTDMIVLATGVTPRIQLAESAGLAIDHGGIRTDRRMRTSVAGIYAVGDIAYAFNPAAGRPLRVEHWGEAEAMGEVAGTVIAGGDAEWAQAPGFWSEIGNHTLKYVAWGDGFDQAQLHRHPGGGFTIWYASNAIVVGALTHEADADYDRGQELVEAGAAVTEV